MLARLDGAPRDRLVAMVLPKGWRQIVAVLAVLKAGAAYLPIDPTLPAERRRLLIERGEAIVLDDPGRHRRRLGARPDRTDVRPPPSMIRRGWPTSSTPRAPPASRRA